MTRSLRLTRRRRRRHDLPSPSRSPSIRPGDPPLGAFSGGAGHPLRGFDDFCGSPAWVGDPPGDLGGRRMLPSFRGGRRGLPDAAENLFSVVSGQPRASGLSDLLRTADCQRQIVDPNRIVPVPAGRDHEDHHGVARRVSLRERGRSSASLERLREAGCHRRSSLSARLPAARPRPRADLSAASGRRVLFRRNALEGLGRDRAGCARGRRGRLVLPEGLSKAAHFHVLQPGPGPIESRLPGAPIQDRRRIGRIFR